MPSPLHLLSTRAALPSRLAFAHSQQVVGHVVAAQIMVVHTHRA